MTRETVDNFKDWFQQYDDRVFEVTKLLEDNEDAMYAFKWMWNNADADVVHWGYHLRVVDIILKLAEQVDGVHS
jgi:hypothetical protein